MNNMTPDELQQQIVQLQNEIRELRGMVSKSQYSNTILQNKNVIQSSGAMQSPNYVPGTSGWAMDSDGNLEAQDGTFRGAISASTISGSTITGGLIQTSATGHRVVIDGDEDNIVFYNSNGDETIILDGAGTAAAYSQMSVGGGIYYSNDVTADYQYGSEIYSGPAGGETNLVIHPIGSNDAYFFFKSNGELNVPSLRVDDGDSGSFTTVDGKTVTVSNGIVTNIS